MITDRFRSSCKRLTFNIVRIRCPVKKVRKKDHRLSLCTFPYRFLLGRCTRFSDEDARRSFGVVRPCNEEPGQRIPWSFEWTSLAKRDESGPGVGPLMKFKRGPTGRIDYPSTPSVLPASRKRFAPLDTFPRVSLGSRDFLRALLLGAVPLDRLRTFAVVSAGFRYRDATVVCSGQ